jgi:hypothetical protein
MKRKWAFPGERGENRRGSPFLIIKARFNN